MALKSKQRPEEELKKCKVNKRCHFSWVPYIHRTETNSPFRSIRSKMYNRQEDEAGSSPKCYSGLRVLASDSGWLSLAYAVMLLNMLEHSH